MRQRVFGLAARERGAQGVKGLSESAAQRRIDRQAAGTRVVTHKPSGQRYLVAMAAGGSAELIPIGGRSKYVKAEELDDGNVWE